MMMIFVPKRVAVGPTKPLSGECDYGTVKIEYAYHTRILFFEKDCTYSNEFDFKRMLAH